MDKLGTWFGTADKPRFLACALAVVTGLMILSLAVPRLVAGFALIPGNHALVEIQKGKTLPAEDLQSVIASRQRASRWASSARINSDLALARLLAGDEAGEEKAKKDLRRSLMQAPANPYAWVRYAALLEKDPKTRGRAAEALIMSLLTGPHEPELADARLGMAFRLWPSISLENRKYVRAQIRHAVWIAPKVIPKYAGNARVRAIMRAALGSSPGLLVKFERWLPKTKR